MRIPDPWSFTLLALGSYRLTRLVMRDKIGSTFRDKMHGEWVGYLIRCPWCAGFWVSAICYSWWTWQPQPTLVLLTVFALSAAVGLLTKNLDKQPRIETADDLLEELMTSAESRN